MDPASYTDTYHVTDLADMTITFLWKQNNSQLVPHILRSYCFVAEVTFNDNLTGKMLDTEHFSVIIDWLASSEAIALSLQNCKLLTVNKFHIT